MIGYLSSESVSSAFTSLFQSMVVDRQCPEVPSRNGPTYELQPAMIEIRDPRRRLMSVFGRDHNPFGCIAEFVWLMAGRNDVAFLTRYLKNASQFSDDGVTWRAGYGPRLRKWRGEVDQIAEVLKCFERDLGTRQAAIMVFDPQADFVVSRDIPCTNWLHYLVRDGKLNAHTVMRSNDLVWGFSAVNVFNFTMLQELIASCLGVKMGKYVHTADSLHVYTEPYKRVLENVTAELNRTRGFDLYHEVPLHSAFPHLPGAGPLERLHAFDNMLGIFHASLNDIHRAFDSGVWLPQEIERATSNFAEACSEYMPFLSDALRALSAHAAFKVGDLELAVSLINRIQDDATLLCCYTWIRNHAPAGRQSSMPPPDSDLVAALSPLGREFVCGSK